MMPWQFWLWVAVELTLFAVVIWLNGWYVSPRILARARHVPTRAAP